MPTTTFDYKVRDADGKLVKGQLEADSVPLVAARLREMGYAPVEIKPVTLNFKREIVIPGITDRVSLKDVALMSRQLATMVAAGLTLVRALSVLADQIESKPLRDAMLQVRQEVEQGSAALQCAREAPEGVPASLHRDGPSRRGRRPARHRTAQTVDHLREAGRAAPEGTLRDGVPARSCSAP